MPRHPLVPLGTIIKTCEEIYKRDGYVRWAEVGDILGISRQVVHARLRDAQADGTLSPEDVSRWQSMATRVALARRRQDTRELNRRLRLDIQLTVENYSWLDAQCAARGCTRADFVNGLINKARAPLSEG